MSTVAGERTIERGAIGRGIDRVLALSLPTSLEFWLYAGLMVVAVLFRFVDLGARALHHDESLHATYSWYLAEGRGYAHDPLMHGPFLFHITALSFLLFGASDASARFPAALLGSIAVLMPLLLRPWLGRIGAFAAAVFIAFSPSILYYSRFIRDDPFLILFTLGLIVSIFRYRASQANVWLYVGAAMLMLGFTSLEVEYIIAAIVLLYLEGALAHDLCTRIGEQRELSAGARTGLYLALLPTAWVIALAWPFIERQRLRWGLGDDLPANGDLLVVFGLLTAPQFSAAIKVPLKFLHYDINAATGYTILGQHLTRVQAIGGLTVILLLLLTFLLGVWWDQRRWLIAAAVFYIPYFLLYTTFLTNKAGWGSGIWGSLSYWLDQQDVRRGTQPVFYFAMTLSSYEYLFLGLAAVALIVQAARRGADALILLGTAALMLPVAVLVNDRLGNVPSIPFVLAAILLATAAMSGAPLRRFLVFYFGALLWGLSVAGEKMPWLTEHPALPLTLLAALAVEDAFGGLQRLRGLALQRGWLVVLGGGAASALAAVLAARQGAAGWRIAAVVVLVAAFATMAALLARWQIAGGRRTALGMAVIAACVGFFGLLTLRTDWRLNFVHPDTPDEMLIYTQSSPDIPKVAKQIAQYALASGQGHNVKITVDAYSSFTWPWAWYLRDYPNTAYPDFQAYANNPSALQPYLGDIVIVHQSDQNIMQPFASRYGQPEHIHHRSWFPEGYRTTTASSFFKRLLDGAELRRWWTYITNRDGFAIPPSDVTSYPRAEEPVGGCNPYTFVDATGRACLGSEDAQVYFPAGYTIAGGLAPAAVASAPSGAVQPAASAASATATTVVTPHSEGATLIFGGTGAAPGQLSRPAELAVDAQGNLYVADSRNDRVQKFDTQGHVLATSGRLSGNATAIAGGVAPEAWGIAVDSAGNVYVADTWNSRIVKLDSSLRVVASWGAPVHDVASPGPNELYGPRGMTIDSDGNLRVADTGDARIMTYRTDGTLLGSSGARGSAPGQFQEPTDIVALPDGGFAVADTWNNRVQLFDRDMRPTGSFTVPWTNGTVGRDSENKPYIAALPDSTLLVTLPQAGRIARYDRSGKQLQQLDRLPGMTRAFTEPLGVAAAPDGTIWVSDGAANLIYQTTLAALDAQTHG